VKPERFLKRKALLGVCSSMDTLPSELILNIFKYFDAFEVIKLKIICKKWYDIISKMDLIKFDDIIMYRNWVKMLNLKNDRFKKFIEREKKSSESIIKEESKKIHLDETGRKYSRLYIKCNDCPIYGDAYNTVCCYIHRKNDKWNHLKHLSFKRVTIEGVVFNDWFEMFRHQLENMDYFVLKTLYFPSNCKFNTYKYIKPIIQYENEYAMCCKKVKKIDIHCQKCIDIDIENNAIDKSRRGHIKTFNMPHTELLDHPFKIQFKQCFLYLSRNLTEALEQIQSLNISTEDRQFNKRIFYKFKNYVSTFFDKQENIEEDTKLKIKQFLATQYPNIKVFYLDNDNYKYKNIPDDFINEDVKELVPDDQSNTEVLLYLRYENYIFDIERNVLKVLEYGTKKKIKLFIYNLLYKSDDNIYKQTSTLKMFVNTLLEKQNIPTQGAKSEERRAELGFPSSNPPASMLEIFAINDDISSCNETMTKYFESKNMKNIKSEDIMYYV